MTVSLAFEPKSREVMKQPPRPVNEALLSGDRIRRILASLYNWTVIFGVFEWARQTTGNIALARTMAIQVVAGRIILSIKHYSVTALDCG